MKKRLGLAHWKKQFLKLVSPETVVDEAASTSLKRSTVFLYIFSFFSNTNFTGKTVDVSRIQTRIVGIEGEHADHLTTTTAQKINRLNLSSLTSNRIKISSNFNKSWTTSVTRFGQISLLWLNVNLLGPFLEILVTSYLPKITSCYFFAFSSANVNKISHFWNKASWLVNKTHHGTYIIQLQSFI